MSLDAALIWFEAHQGLVAWLGLGGSAALFVFGWLCRTYGRGAAKRIAVLSSVAAANDAARCGALAAEAAVSKLLLLAEAANNAGGGERRSLASEAGEHLGVFQLIEQRTEDLAIQSELENACNAIRAFQQAVLNWHGLHDSDDSQRIVGVAAIERVRLSAGKLSGIARK